MNPESPDLTGTANTGCNVTRLREWVRIDCTSVGRRAQSGGPIAIVAKGLGPHPSANNILYVHGEGQLETVLVYRFAQGTKVDATFELYQASFRFLSAWPEGAEQPASIGHFEKVARDEVYGRCIGHCADGIDSEPYPISCKEKCEQELASRTGPAASDPSSHSGEGSHP